MQIKAEDMDLDRVRQAFGFRYNVNLINAWFISLD